MKESLLPAAPGPVLVHAGIDAPAPEHPDRPGMGAVELGSASQARPDRIEQAVSERLEVRVLHAHLMDPIDDRIRLGLGGKGSCEGDHQRRGEKGRSEHACGHGGSRLGTESPAGAGRSLGRCDQVRGLNPSLSVVR
jgi:hypothetical protein